jgi:NADH-ubiquinone oxidoreductase chain 2
MIIYSLLFLLLSNSLTARRDKSILFNRLTITILIYALILSILGLYLVSLYRGIGLFGSLFNATSITQVFHIFILVISAIILQLTAFYPRRVWLADYSSIYKIVFYKFLFYATKIINKLAEQFKIIEYPLIILFIISGALFLVSTSDLVSIFLSIELQSYGLYLLSTLYRNSEFATSGGLTYFLLGGLSSCLILLGTSLLYTNSGSSNLDGIYVITSLSELANQDSLAFYYTPYYINFAFLILSVGFLFKASAAPFHFWSPDVYDAIPTIVTTFVAIVAKISIFVFLLELVHYTSNSLFSFEYSWTSNLLISSLLSLIIGTVVGLSQFRIKRLFAYSTISHVGFILLALSINSVESIQAFIFYLMQYSISNLNAFIILVSIGFSLYYFNNTTQEYKVLNDKSNSPIQLISQLKGYFYINPYLALSLAITIFSFAGIPPLIGFFAKQMVLSAALDGGYVFISLVAVLTSVIGAVYYLNIIKQVFFDSQEYSMNEDINNMSLQGSIVKDNKVVNNLTFGYNNIILSKSLTITISVLTLLTLLFIFMPDQWLSMANILALILFNT